MSLTVEVQTWYPRHDFLAKERFPRLVSGEGGTVSANLGARFYKADFHVHTPESTDYKGKKIAPKDLVNDAVGKGLDILGVTDHNSADWVDGVRSAAKGTALTVFPGVEITTPHCHVLAIFDRDTPKAVLDDLLSSVGIAPDKRGKEEAVSEDLESVLEKIARKGGLAIAAHANSDKGLLQEGSGQFRMKVFNREDLAAVEFTQEQHVKRFMLGQVPGYGPKACLQGSDAHCLAELGRRFTFLKMDGVSLRGIQQALLDYEVRVRFAWDVPPEPTYPRITRMTVNQGFFEGASFEFNPSLNCFVGGKGVGKSTVIEFLRYCFSDISSIPDIADDTNGKVSTLLGEGGSIAVDYLDSDGELKAIECEFSSEEPRRSIKDPAGNSAEIFSPPVFFSQGELTRIAASPLAQMDLLDRYLDLSAEVAGEGSCIDALRSNAEKLQDLIRQSKKIVEEIENVDNGLAASKNSYELLQKTLKNPVLVEFPKWESENRYVENVIKTLDAVADGFDVSIDALDVAGQLPSDLASDSPNYGLFIFVKDSAASIIDHANAAKAQFRREIENKKTDIQEILKEWNLEFGEKKKEYEATLLTLGEQDVRRAQSKLRGLRARLDELERKDQRYKQILSQIGQFQKQREELLDGMAQSRKSRYEKRQQKAAEWQAGFRDRIRLQVKQMANYREYFDALKNLVKGSRLRDSDLLTFAKLVPPRELTRVVVSSDALDLAAKTGLKTEPCQKLLFTLQAHEWRDVLELEVSNIEDTLEIEYEVEHGRNKGLNELSVGGKGTVILSLALVEGDSPLVIDQPEEPLDTLAIHEQIVGTLRKQKDSRQFIFTTHNPNIAVGGDAELNYILEASADQGKVKSSGGVDHVETNKLLLHHLEGGIVAFELRRRKYIR
jgi:predicted metal-dependent phosphoesterase TrpH/predicted ATPase